jgi:hypothetical protein
MIFQQEVCNKVQRFYSRLNTLVVGVGVGVGKLKIVVLFSTYLLPQVIYMM